MVLIRTYDFGYSPGELGAFDITNYLSCPNFSMLVKLRISFVEFKPHRTRETNVVGSPDIVSLFFPPLALFIALCS